ncbi:MAG TPA: peptidoglycan DD-metalloendopeptidase family protein [Thermoanaerobaculia bacterium]|nr:peptidoglycan DD-metalloendopeptidase family protein [Thermoanaerobaculia bacterium]
MSKRHHTVIFVPHAHTKLRKWRISNLQIGVAVGALVLLTVAAALALWSFFSTPSNPAEVARLRQENEQLRLANHRFETSIQSLQNQLGSYEERTRQLAIVAGLENLGEGVEAGIGGGEPMPPIADLGAGGPAPGEEARGEIDATDLPEMASRAEHLAGTLDQVQAKLDERMRWLSATPAITPVRGILTSGFGYRSDPVTHGRGVHQGVDIAAATGQPVKASADGIVIRAGVEGGLGQAVFLSHGYGLTTRYGHLSRIDVRPGQRVKRGEVVGRVGNTGRSTGPHLHYEVRVDGEPVNPLAYLYDHGAGGS